VLSDTFDFEDIASAGTGLTAPDGQSEYEIARALLIRQSVEMEDRLARVGVDLRPKPSNQNVVSIGNVTMTRQGAERSFRKCRFLPIVAKADRAQWIREFEYFLRHDPKGRYARYGVITCGQREEFGRGFVKSAKRSVARTESNIRKWINESRDDYGIDVILKTFELAPDEVSAHNHFNVTYIPRRKLRKGEFSRWLSFSRRRLGSHWRDCGRIRDIREVIKYSCKITGPDSLEALDDAAFKNVFELLHGKTTIHAHGSFKAFRKRLETEKKKVVWMRRANAPAYLVVMKKQTKPRTPGPKPEDEKKENLILGRQLPRALGTGLLEPVTIVQNYCENPTTAEGKRRLKVLRGQIAQAREWAARNGADLSAYTVHTNTANVLDPSPGGGRSLPSQGVTTPGDGAGRSGESREVRAVIPPRPKTLNRPTCEPPRPVAMERGPDGKWREVRPKGRVLIPPRRQALARPLCAPPRPRIMERGPDGRWRDAGLAKKAAARRRLPPVRSFRPLGGG
jgi:hypothetical protein